MRSKAEQVDRHSFTLRPRTGFFSQFSLKEVQQRLAANRKRYIEEGRFNINTSSPPVRTKH